MKYIILHWLVVTFFSTLEVSKVHAVDCDYPIVIPAVTSIIYEPANGLPRAIVTLTTSYTIENFLFWVIDSEFEVNISRRNEAYYPLYEEVNNAVPVHTSQSNEHTFSVYTPRKLAIYQLVVELNIGCQIMTMSVPLSPDNTTTFFPIRLGTIDKVPPAEVVFRQDEWFDFEMTYPSHLTASFGQVYFRNSSYHKLADSYGPEPNTQYVVDTNNSGVDRKDGKERRWVRAKANPDVKELVMHFHFYIETFTAEPMIVVNMVSSFHTDEPTEPIIATSVCTHYQTELDVDGDVTIVPTSSKTEGCLRVSAYGNPVPEVVVAKMADRNTVTSFLAPNGGYYLSLYPIVNMNVYHLDKMLPGLEQDYAIVARNSQGLKAQRFRSKSFEDISIKALCVDEACDEQGRIRLNSAAVGVQLQCQTTGPVEKVVFRKRWGGPNDVLDEQVPTPNSNLFSFNLSITSDTLKDIRPEHYRRVVCAAVGEYGTKSAAFDFIIESNGG